MGSKYLTCVAALCAAVAAAPVAIATPAASAASSGAGSIGAGSTGAGSTWTILVSVGDGGEQTSEYRSEIGAVSATGRYVVFTAAAPNLAAGDLNETWDAFVRDRVAGTTTLVSATSAGTPANSSSYGGSITADGRYVMISSLATDLRDDDDDGDTFDVYIRDMRTGALSLASRNSRGVAGNGSSHGNMMTPDGRYVAFASTATNLVPGDTNGAFDVFLRDRRAGVTTLVSVPDGGGRANAESGDVAISADGRYVVFTSDATNLVPGQTQAGVFLRDRGTGRTYEVSVSPSGESCGGSGPKISPDGRYVGFNSASPNLVPDDTNNEGDVFLRRMR